VGGNETVLAPSLAVTGNMVALDGAIFGTAGPGQRHSVQTDAPANVMAFWTVKTISPSRAALTALHQMGLFTAMKLSTEQPKLAVQMAAGTVFKVRGKASRRCCMRLFSAELRRWSAPASRGDRRHGALYGTTRNGGNGQGVVFKVTPHGESALYRFCPQAPCVDGAYPYAGVIEVDGSLYGATAGGGTANFGAVFKLSL